MKKIILSMIIALMTTVSACSQDKKSKTVDIIFEVCENHKVHKTAIKKATNNLKGVVKTTWDKKNREIVVSYNENEITRMEICRAITKSICDSKVSKGDKKRKINKT